MRSFDYSRLYDKTWDTNILNLIAKIHESKGRQDFLHTSASSRPVKEGRKNYEKIGGCL